MVTKLLDIFHETERIERFLEHSRRAGETVDDLCARQESALGPGCFAEALFYLTHKVYECEEARAHWREIIQHRERLTAQTGRKVNLLAAVVDYFTTVHPAFEAPVSLEADALARCARLTMLDELTGLFNRRFFNTEMEREMERSRRLERPMSLLMVDIDHFKQFNDSFGHAAGDKVLSAVAGVLREKARLTDQPARYGGEEFVVILPHTDKQNAFVVAERYRETVAGLCCTDVNGSQLPSVTISIGMAQYPDDAKTTPEMIDAADRALYRAKSQGRNMVCDDSEELRAARRMSLQLDAECRLRACGGPPIAARATNISAGGLRCETNCGIAPGTRLDILLRDPNGGPVLPMPARTVWSTPIEEACFRHGLSFEVEPSRAIFQLERYFNSLAGTA